MGTREARGAVQMLLEGRDERERRGVEVGWRATSEWCMKLARHEAPNHRMIQMFSFVHQVSRLTGAQGRHNLAAHQDGYRHKSTPGQGLSRLSSHNKYAHHTPQLWEV